MLRPSSLVKSITEEPALRAVTDSGLETELLSCWSLSVAEDYIENSSSRSIKTDLPLSTRFAFFRCFLVIVLDIFFCHAFDMTGCLGCERPLRGRGADGLSTGCSGLFSLSKIEHGSDVA